MISIQSKISHDSTVKPGVKFNVRVLNKIRRAKRDLPIIEARAKCSALAAEYAPIGKLIERKALEGGLSEIVNDGRTPEQKDRCFAIDAEYTWLDNGVVKPAIIRAGLVSIDGLEIDGACATAETLIENAGPDFDDFIEEVFLACEAASGLTPIEIKNSGSDTTSTGRVVSESTASSVTPAGNYNCIGKGTVVSSPINGNPTEGILSGSPLIAVETTLSTSSIREQPNAPPR